MHQIRTKIVALYIYLLKDINNIYFKGGTAINKILLKHARLSEDVDFTLTDSILKVEKEIKDKLKGTIFRKISHDKKVDKFVRLVVHYKLFHDEGTIFIDLNERAKLLQKPEKHELHHFYKQYIPSFSMNTIGKEELIAEKMAAAIGRNKPRDHFDLYEIIMNKMNINMEMVKKKCKESGNELDITKMFNNAKKLHSRWDDDLASLIRERITFQEVMQTLAKHFKLKEEKKKLRGIK